MSQVWNYILQELAEQLPEDEYNAWIAPLDARENNTRLDIFAPNSFILSELKSQYNNQIQLLIKSSTHTEIELSYQVGRRANETIAIPSDDSIESHLLPHLSFDHFVDGKTTNIAYAAACQVAENPGPPYNPLFIYGDTGLGKTHLMHAIGNELTRRSPKSRVLYLRSHSFVEQMVSAIRNNSIQQFKQFFQGLDVLLIDDIQFFSGKSASQEEFFNTYNILLEGNKQIVITSDKYPKAVELQPRLRSRFGAGVTVQVEPPDLETRIAILMKKADQSGFQLPEEVAHMIAQLVQSNVRELEGALNNVRASTQLTGESLTIESARRVLRELIIVQTQLVSIDNIQKVICDHYNILLTDLLSKKRSKSLVYPRHIAMALSREMTQKSLPEIARAFNRKDHTTVMNACSNIERQRKENPTIDQDYRYMQRLLNA